MSRLPLLALACALAACGARSPLGELDSGSSDAADVDAFGPIDAARPDAALPSGCVAEAFDIATMVGQLDYPALARNGDAVMLVVTQRVDDGPATVLLLPLDLSLGPRGDFRTIAPGEGGTLVPSTLDPTERGFTLAFRNGSGVLAGARFDPEGRAVGVAPIGTPIAGVRPLLVLTPILSAIAFDPVMGTRAEGQVTELPTARASSFELGGRAPVGARDERDDAFLAATVDGSRGIVERFDARGRLLETRVLEPSVPASFPLALLGARVVGGATDAGVLHGGVVRALEQSFLQLSFGDASHVWDPVGDVFYDEVAAAYEGGWLGASLGALHDEGISRAPTPHVFFRALARDGRSAELTLAGPLEVSGPSSGRQIRTAIITAGIGPVTFLVVYTWNEAERGHVDGARVVCSR